MLTLNFITFLLISIGGYWVLKNQKHKIILLNFMSLGYIFLLDFFTGIFVLSLTAVTWFLGKIVYDKRNISIVALSIVLVTASLLYFKYSSFFLTLLNLKDFVLNEKIFLPLGISYITFKHISYLMDIYWEKIERGKFIDFLLYSSFFPIYLAGPIERFENFEPQLREKISFSSSHFEEGYKRFVLGMFKKYMLADGIGILITRNIASNAMPEIPPEVVNLFLFSLQIYFDFAGYSDMAIGASRFFGIKIMENFDNPYLKSNISLFWNSWHISLSAWLRDYIFYPLSFALREHKLLNYFTPVVTMFVCGLWHGASTGFIIWGLWHGMGLVLYQFWAKTSLARKLKSLPGQTFYNIVGAFVTFVFVTIGWLWFR